jgi:hypothetical protein
MIESVPKIGALEEKGAYPAEIYFLYGSRRKGGLKAHTLPLTTTSREVERESAC